MADVLALARPETRVKGPAEFPGRRGTSSEQRKVEIGNLD